MCLLACFTNKRYKWIWKGYFDECIENENNIDKHGEDKEWKGRWKIGTIDDGKNMSYRNKRRWGLCLAYISMYQTVVLNPYPPIKYS